MLAPRESDNPEIAEIFDSLEKFELFLEVNFYSICFGLNFCSPHKLHCVHRDAQRTHEERKARSTSRSTHKCVTSIATFL